MVHLFRGGSAGGRGRGFARPPGFIPRHIRPNWFEPDFVPPFGFGGPIPNTLARPPLRPGPRPHRIPAPPLPPPPLRPRPLPPLVRHFPPIPLCPPGRGLSIPPHMPSGNFRSTIGHTLPLRGRGGHANRGAQVKRLVSPNDRAKKQQKRKERTEETEINKPWVTETLKTEIRKKFQLYYLAKGKNVDSDWQAYKDQKALVSNMTHTAKLEYIGLHPEADVDLIMFGGSSKKLK